MRAADTGRRRKPPACRWPISGERYLRASEFRGRTGGAAARPAVHARRSRHAARRPRSWPARTTTEWRRPPRVSPNPPEAPYPGPGADRGHSSRPMRAGVSRGERTATPTARSEWRPGDHGWRSRRPRSRHAARARPVPRRAVRPRSIVVAGTSSSPPRTRPRPMAHRRDPDAHATSRYHREARDETTVGTVVHEPASSNTCAPQCFSRTDARIVDRKNASTYYVRTYTVDHRRRRHPPARHSPEHIREYPRGVITTSRTGHGHPDAHHRTGAPRDSPRRGRRRRPQAASAHRISSRAAAESLVPSVFSPARIRAFAVGTGIPRSCATSG